MRREGPSFFQWLAGKLTYPAPRDRCAGCGAPGVSEEVQSTLAKNGMAGAARLAELCEPCRRRALRSATTR